MIGPGLFAIDDGSDSLFLIRSKEGDRLEIPTSRVRVLVVDDQKLIADSLAEILGISGFEAKSAYDGKEALEVMARFNPRWVVSDVVMPHMNGVELAIAIRMQYPTTKILLFSGQAGISEILLDAQSQGYEFELIAKPVHPKKLIARLSGH